MDKGNTIKDKGKGYGLRKRKKEMDKGKGRRKRKTKDRCGKVRRIAGERIEREGKWKDEKVKQKRRNGNQRTR